MRIYLGLVWVSIAALAGTAAAADFTIATTADAGPGSLREALTAANAAPAEAHTITITATGTLQLVTALPVVRASFTLTGPGAALFELRGNATFTVLSLQGSTAAITGITVSNGRGPAFSGAGGIDLRTGALTLTDSVISGNTSSIGAGIMANGPITLTRCVVRGNSGYGALYASRDATITDSTFADNVGTAIVFPPAGGFLTIERSTFSGNSSTSGVGAIQLQGGTANITNSTFSANIGRQGGDFWTYSDGVVFNLVNVTSSDSSAPAMLYDHFATVNLRNTLLAGTGARCALAHAITSGGHNLVTDTTCAITGPADQQAVAAAFLGPLADNGGPTRTHALFAGSPAIDAGDAATLPTTDQRGRPRIGFAAPDIGAYEAASPEVTGPTDQTVLVGATLTLAVTATNPSSTVALTYQWRHDGAAITGAISATYTVASAQLTDAGRYDVQVSNENGTLTSTPATVTVTVPPIVDAGPTGPDAGGGDGGGGCTTAPHAPGAGAGLLAGLLAVLLGRRRRGAR